MNYATIKPTDVANGPGVRVSLFVSGCPHHCKDCFNEEAWDFSYGEPFTEETQEELLGLMDHPLQKNGDEVLLSFLDRQLYRQYTKVVYVAGAVHEAVAGTLSGLVDFSVLLASENSASYLSGNGGYTTVGLPVGQLRSGEFVIPL